MSETRPYPRSGRRQIVDYPRFLIQSSEYVLVCINRAVLDVARVLIKSRGFWPTSYALSYGNDNYTIVGDAEIDNISELLGEFLKDTDAMNCDDLTVQLAAIVDAVASKTGGGPCSCGAGGAGTINPPASTVDPGPPGERTGDPPDGFSTWTEYETYKCDVSEWIWQGVKTDLTWWQGANFLTLLATAFVAGLITPIPGDEIAALLGFLVALAVQGSITAAVSEMLDAMNNSKAELICALYGSDTASDARTAIVFEIGEAIDVETSAVWAPIAKSVLNSMFGFEVINKLYVRDEALVDSDLLPTGDCSGCTPCPEYFIIDGTDNGGYNFSSVAETGEHQVKVYFESTGDLPGCSPMRDVTLSALVGHTDSLFDDDFGVWDTVTQTYESDTPFTTECARLVRIRSATAFSCTLTPADNC